MFFSVNHNRAKINVDYIIIILKADILHLECSQTNSKTGLVKSNGTYLKNQKKPNQNC